jgi:hypothetical protein
MSNELDEGRLKNAIAAGSLAAAALLGGSDNNVKPPAGLTKTEYAAELKRLNFKNWAANLDKRVKNLTSSILEKYPKSNPRQVADIVQAAIKYEAPVWPKAEDILSIVGVESSFRDKQKSNLGHDPALGFMQIRAGIWEIPAAELHTVEGGIKHGSAILKQYYVKLKNIDAAVEAYNVGITNYKTGKQKNPEYVRRYQSTLDELFSND